MSQTSLEETSANYHDAAKGFDHLFANDLQKARDVFEAGGSSFHMIGMGICAFLEAALGMEVSPTSLRMMKRLVV